MISCRIVRQLYINCKHENFELSSHIGARVLQEDRPFDLIHVYVPVHGAILELGNCFVDSTLRPSPRICRTHFLVSMVAVSLDLDSRDLELSEQKAGFSLFKAPRTRRDAEMHEYLTH